MNYEIDLELYTLSIININSAFSKLEYDEFDIEGIKLLKKSIEDFNKLYQNTLIDMSLREINYGEYDYFLMTVFTTFPKYVENIENYNLRINNELKLLLKEIVELLNNFVKISEDYLKKRGVIS